MPTNASLERRSLRAIWHPCTQMKQHSQWPLIPIERASGVWLTDFDGNRYFDAIGSWWVNLFGHGEARIAGAIDAQLKRLDHVMLAGFTHEPVIELSERLSKLCDRTLGHAFYASDGASAVEIALKMSFHFWRNHGQEKKNEFVCLAGSYHGETVGALAVTDVAIFRDAYAPLIRAAQVLPSPDARLANGDMDAAEVARRAAAALECYLVEHHRTTAALIIEPLIQCAAGFVFYHSEYLRLARQLCDSYRVHLICDEIAVGFGRTGTFFAHEQAGIRPDFLCLSKGITGGFLPLSVVLTTDGVFDAFYDDDVARGFLHSHSYTGNALACSAALAVLDIFDQDDVLAANRVRAQKLVRALEPLIGHPRVRHFRQLGMIVAFDYADPPADFARRFAAIALRHELLLRPIGNTVYLMPPYLIDDALIGFLAERLQAVLDEFAPACGTGADCAPALP